jgi:phospholipid transport system substrate-binding protein
MKSWFRLTGILLFTGFMTARAEVSLPPDVQAKNTTNEVLAIIKKDKDIQTGNMDRIYALVDEKILPHFDFARMTQLAVGKNWGKATPVQRQGLIREFRALLVRTYAASLTTFSNTQVDFKPLRMQPDDTDVTVKTEVKLPGAQPIPIDYSMEKMDDGWKVYDVAVDGVSLVTVYRSSFAQEVRRNGIDGLIELLARKNTNDKDKAASTK